VATASETWPGWPGWPLACRTCAQPGAANLTLGTRRARAAVLLPLALPGSSYRYQGEELGLWEVEEIPDELIADPIFLRSEHRSRGRDGCRVPLPWHPGAPGFGFGPAGGAAPWLPQPAAWRQLAVAAQAEEPGSMPALYHAALRVPAARDCLNDDSLTWLTAPDNALAFSRPGRFACVVNISAARAAPAGRRRTACRRGTGRPQAAAGFRSLAADRDGSSAGR